MDTGSHDSLIPETDGKSKGSDDPAARRETLAAHRTPVVLIVDTIAHRSAAIKAWAWQHRGVRPMFATTSTVADAETAAREQPEVAILHPGVPQRTRWHRRRRAASDCPP